MSSNISKDTLFVCVLCRFPETSSSKTEFIPGQMLFDQLRHELAQSDQETINLQPVRCMGACSRACTAAFMAPNKLTFVLSQLSPIEAIPDLLEFSRQYTACSDGKVPYKDRPMTIKQKIHAVLPPLPSNP